LSVNGGTFYRTFQNAGSGPGGEADPATVSNFRLDKYEVTVGRFRQFVAAYNAGTWTSTVTQGSGKHTHLSGGQGLANSGSTGSYESGWNASDDAHVSLTPSNLTHCMGATWTAATSIDENLPINCVNWYEAYAFCIWDGGFLPSEAEWEYAAVAGSQQREYPWGSTTPGTACPGTGCQYAIYNCDYPTGPGSTSCVIGTGHPTGTIANIAPVGTATLGAGVYGQLDLGGNVWEWNLDSFNSTYVNPCNDCAYLGSATGRVFAGGGFDNNEPYLHPPVREGLVSVGGANDVGFRCARAP
jgi:formylglycine-generating enzyme required for sulfatase activity